MRKKISLLLLLLPLLCACTWMSQLFPPRIDSSSVSTFNISLNKVRIALPADQQVIFTRALQTVKISRLAQSGFFVGSQDRVDASLRAQLNDKSAADVIAMAEEITRHNEEQQQADIADEIKDLEARKAAATTYKEQFERFKVLGAHFYKQADLEGALIPMLEIAVENHTPFDVASVIFTATLLDVGSTAEPLVKQTYSYRLVEPLPSGKSARWELPQKKFSKWGDVQALPSRRLLISIDRLFDDKDQPLFPDMRFTADDAARLVELTTAPVADDKNTEENIPVDAKAAEPKEADAASAPAVPLTPAVVVPQATQPALDSTTIIDITKPPSTTAPLPTQQ